MQVGQPRTCVNEITYLLKDSVHFVFPTDTRINCKELNRHISVIKGHPGIT